ncbi:MAG: hypothetical protein RIS90_1853 [Pseudomonadota bacterium]
MSLWDKAAGAVPIDASQLTVGLFVWLDLKWSEHPFISNRMLLKSADDIATMQSLNVAGRLYYLPDKSEVALPPLQSKAGGELVGGLRPAAKFAVPQQLQDSKKLALDRQRQQRAVAERVDRAWELVARETRDVLLSFGSAPKAAGTKLRGVSSESAAAVMLAQEVSLHFLGRKTGGGQQLHAVNVMALCLLLGKKMGLDEQALTDLAMAALVHDVGKSEVPVRILGLAKRNKYEEDQYRQHLRHSLFFATQSGMFSPQALMNLADHHEAMDGSGWPSGKKDLGIGARILSLVDRYDRLCMPEAIDVTPLVPMEALSTLLKRESGRFDTAVLGHLIKLLGIYPPGTLVQLSDGSLGQVVGPGAHSLKPKVLLYNRLTSKEEAQVLELDKTPDVKVTAAVHPASLPAEVRAWIKPEQPQVYFFSGDSLPR